MSALTLSVRPLRIIPLLVTLLSIYTSIGNAQEKSAVQVVTLFVELYGGPHMDEIAEYTTPSFRGNKPKSVWVVDTWRALHKLQYKKLDSTVVGSKVTSDKAIVITEAKLRTAAGEVAQKEIYYLVKQGERWLIDDLQVTDEEIDIDKVQL